MYTDYVIDVNIPQQNRTIHLYDLDKVFQKIKTK